MTDPHLSAAEQSLSSASLPAQPPVSNTEASPLREDGLMMELLATLRGFGLANEKLDLVDQAFTYARQKHDGQKRKNGENYIVHPVNVALIVAEYTHDVDAIMAALLHDTLEDTDATADEITQHFGEQACRLVEGVTKLGKYALASLEDRQAENFRRMFLAMANDVRVIVVKLSDRLHNMRTLHHLRPDKQQRIANETLEIFAPLANRLGIGKLRAELEDLSLKYLDTDSYQLITDSVTHTQDSRERTIQYVMEKVGGQLADLHIDAKIKGRVKNTYSIYRKMRGQNKELKDIYDISAVRVIVPEERDCYAVLGLVHNTFSPIPGRFKDYIAMPKSNLYRSLHTTVMGPLARPLEVQIRTEAMHQVAEYGIAAHWKYKETGGSTETNSDEQVQASLKWMRQMLEAQDDSEGASDYVELVKLDLFQDEVFVFSPKGQVVDLPKGSTCVDFAYRIHTEVGHTCSGATVNGKIVPLNHCLDNGDIVEIIRRKNAQPRLDWLHFVRTQTAKNRIRQWFKRHKRDEHETNGRKALEAELTRVVFDEVHKNGELQTIGQEMSYELVEDLLVAIGYGEVNLTRVVNRVRKLRSVAEKEDVLAQIKKFQKHRIKTPSKKAPIPSLAGMLYHLARCCTPVPGEDIIGVVTRSRGVMVHREDCHNLNHVTTERKMALYWAEDVEHYHETHTVRLEVHVIDRVGVMKDILGNIADTHTNVSNIRVKVNPDHTAFIELTVDVSNAHHVDRVKNAIKRIPDVLGVKRQQFRTGKGDGSE